VLELNQGELKEDPVLGANLIGISVHRLIKEPLKTMKST
jgi:hypothetical protein